MSSQIEKTLGSFDILSISRIVLRFCEEYSNSRTYKSGITDKNMCKISEHTLVRVLRITPTEVEILWRELKLLGIVAKDNLADFREIAILAFCLIPENELKTGKSKYELIYQTKHLSSIIF